MIFRLRVVLLGGIVLGLGVWIVLIGAQELARAAQGESGGAELDSRLRGAFLGKDNDPAQSHRIVGRLAILLKTDEGTRRVRPDYLFRSGDRFRFEITANQNGWLYVMHAAPGGGWQQLWPTKFDNNKVQADQSYEIPPRPGIFVFDKDTGNEFFYVVIRPDPEAPTLETSPRATSPPVEPARHTESPTQKATAAPPKTVATAPTPAGTITNFLVRDPFGETTRGVVFDPGTDDADPCLYFSAAAKDTSKAAKVKFQLHHVD